MFCLRRVKQKYCVPITIAYFGLWTFICFENNEIMSVIVFNIILEYVGKQKII